MEVCPHCNSLHDPDQYSVGWVLYFDEEGLPQLERVEGEGEILARLRDPDQPGSHVFWTEKGAKAAIKDIMGG